LKKLKITLRFRKRVIMMSNRDIRNFRMSLGKFLHNYYVKFGEEKYDKFIELMGENMSLLYGEPFNSENLRIMEAEYVTLNSVIYDKRRINSKKIII